MVVIELNLIIHLLLTSAVCGIAGSKRAHPFVLYGAGQRAELALRAPASARVAAALGLGHAVPVGGWLLAHGLQNLDVTVALSVVWRKGHQDTRSVRDGRRQEHVSVAKLPRESDHSCGDDTFTLTAFDHMLFCLTDTFRSSGARLEAVVALAAVASHGVDTASVLADARLGTALVQVCQRTEQKDGRMRRAKRTEDDLSRRREHLDSPMHPSPSGLRCMPGGQIHMKVPIRFLQVIPLESQSSRPSEHSSWSGEGQWQMDNYK